MHLCAISGFPLSICSLHLRAICGLFATASSQLSSNPRSLMETLCDSSVQPAAAGDENSLTRWYWRKLNIQWGAAGAGADEFASVELPPVEEAADHLLSSSSCAHHLVSSGSELCEIEKPLPSHRPPLPRTLSSLSVAPAAESTPA